MTERSLKQTRVKFTLCAVPINIFGHLYEDPLSN